MPSPPPTSGSSSGGKTPTRRLIKELGTWRAQQSTERGIERLGPNDESDLFQWEAVVNGREIGYGYDGARAPPHFPPTRSNSVV